MVLVITCGKRNNKNYNNLYYFIPVMKNRMRETGRKRCDERRCCEKGNEKSSGCREGGVEEEEEGREGGYEMNEE